LMVSCCFARTFWPSGKKVCHRVRSFEYTRSEESSQKRLIECFFETLFFCLLIDDHQKCTPFSQTSGMRKNNCVDLCERPRNGQLLAVPPKSFLQHVVKDPEKQVCPPGRVKTNFFTTSRRCSKICCSIDRFRSLPQTGRMLKRVGNTCLGMTLEEEQAGDWETLNMNSKTHCNLAETFVKPLECNSRKSMTLMESREKKFPKH
jgi:hypothetical protein